MREARSFWSVRDVMAECSSGDGVLLSLLICCVVVPLLLFFCAIRVLLVVLWTRQWTKSETCVSTGGGVLMYGSAFEMGCGA